MIQMNVSDLYNLFPDVLLIHGISKIGAESKVPPDILLADRINHSINISKTKLSTYSYKNDVKSDISNYYGSIGLIIGEGEILFASNEDTGFTLTNLPIQFDSAKANWHEILSPKTYNEIIVKNVSVIGLVVHYTFDFSMIEIQQACRNVNLPMYFNNGIRMQKINNC